MEPNEFVFEMWETVINGFIKASKGKKEITMSQEWEEGRREEEGTTAEDVLVCFCGLCFICWERKIYVKFKFG